MVPALSPEYRDARRENKDAYIKKFDDFVQEYGGQWIAVLDGEVVQAVHPEDQSVDTFWDSLQDRYGIEGVQQAYSVQLPEQIEDHDPIRID